MQRFAQPRPDQRLVPNQFSRSCHPEIVAMAHFSALEGPAPGAAPSLSFVD
jgi:hypothetical protein